jgi:BlaI family penicillinase repressor
MPDLIPTDRELEALKVLWQQGPTAVADVCAALKKQGADLAYTTVLSLLQVMEQKGLISHRQSGKAYVYFARVERESTFRLLARGFLHKVFDGALDEYLVHALRSKTTTPEELDRLAQTIAEAKSRTRSRHQREKNK